MSADDIFKGKEINALLQAAARLQEEDDAKNDPGLGLSLAEVEEIAAESGIDPKYIRQAALISTIDGADDDGTHFWGGPITVRRKFLVNRALTKREMEDLVPTIQRISDNAGSTDSLNNSLTWTSHTRKNQGSMLVMMQTEGDKTICNLKAPVMMPGFLIHYIPLILTFMIGLPFAATNGFSTTVLAIAAVLMTSMFLVTRFAYGKYADSKKRQIKQIEEAIHTVGRAVAPEEDKVSSPVARPASNESAPEKSTSSGKNILDIDEDVALNDGPNDGKARELRRMRE